MIEIYLFQKKKSANAQIRCVPFTYTLCPGSYLNGKQRKECSPPPLTFRVRDLPARVALFHEHGGLLPDAGRAAADARRSLPMSRLAGPPGCHHLPARADAVLHLVSTPASLLPHSRPINDPILHLIVRHQQTFGLQAPVCLQ